MLPIKRKHVFRMQTLVKSMGYNRLIILSFLLLWVSCVQKSSNQGLPPKINELPQGAADISDKTRYKELVNEMKLVDDPAQPTALLSDDTFRSTLAGELTKQTEKIQCESARFLSSPVTQLDNRVDVYHLAYKLNIISETLQSFLIVPKGKSNLSVLLYAHSGWEKPFKNLEVYDVLGNQYDKFTTFVPALRDEDFMFGTTVFKSKRMNFEQAWISDVDRLLGVVMCAAKFKDSLILADGKKLGEKWAPITNQQTLPSVTVGGTGSGAATALLAVARSGAMAYQSKTSSPQWVRTDCAFVVNPLMSIYGAENRLLLYNLVSGQTEDTRYTSVPGVTDLRKELFFRWRQNQIDMKTVAQQLLFRDVFSAAPFVNFGLKNYRKGMTEKGPLPGALLIASENGRSDFSVNQSRIFANIATTVQFKVTEQINGIDFLYREYFTDLKGLDASYKNPFAENFFKTAGQIIPNLFVRYPSEMKGKPDQEHQYNWVIRGRAYEGNEGKSWYDTLTPFLNQSCLTY